MMMVIYYYSELLHPVLFHHFHLHCIADESCPEGVKRCFDCLVSLYYIIRFHSSFLADAVILERRKKIIHINIYKMEISFKNTFSTFCSRSAMNKYVGSNFQKYMNENDIALWWESKYLLHNLVALIESRSIDFFLNETTNFQH